MEIERIKRKNCIIHICDDAIAKTKEEQDRIWQSFSESAYQLYLKITKEGVKNQ